MRLANPYKRRPEPYFKQISNMKKRKSPGKTPQSGEFQQVPSTTVVDRRSAEASHVFCSGNAEHEIDVVFAIGTSAADAQRRAIRARAGE
jgi:hypothetical protein